MRPCSYNRPGGFGPSKVWASLQLASCLGVSIVLGSSAVEAQAEGGGAAAAPAAPAAAAPAAAPAGIPGVPALPAGFDPNSHLDSSSRAKSDISQPDGFDLDRARGSSGPVRGDAKAGAAEASGTRGAAGTYVVKTGDTLSKISENVYGKPWMWPKLWSQNTQIQNPHWIYPGDQVRLSSSTPNVLRGTGASLTLGSGLGLQSGPTLGEHAVFLGESGYIDDPASGIAGEVVGAVQPVQLMTQGDAVYIAVRPDQQLQPGQTIQIFRDVRDPPKVAGARQPPGKIVAIKGQIRLDYVNQEKRVARGVIIESRDTIERGDKVAAVPLSFMVVPQRPATKNLVARLLTSMRPIIFVGREDVVFIDRGSEDGLQPGNRLFVIRRGDTWRRTFDTTSVQARTRIELDNSEGLQFEVAPLHGNEQDFPEEIVGEIRIIKTQRFSSYALVTGSRTELVPGDRAVSRVGF